MARVKIEFIFSHLSYEIKRAFIGTIKKNFPELQFDEQKIYKEFADTVSKECKKWENVPDDAVEKGDY